MKKALAHTAGPWKRAFWRGTDKHKRPEIAVHSVSGQWIGDVVVDHDFGDKSAAEQEGNAAMFAAAPDLLAVAHRLHLSINGLHATMRSTNAAYRASTLCAEMDLLIRDNAAAIAKAEGRDA